VLLTADAALDLRANPDMEAQGVAIEAHLDRGRGPVATVLITRGTLRCRRLGGRRRRLRSRPADGRRARRGRHRGSPPSRPAQVIGFTSVPGAGDNFLVVDEDRIARQIADRRSAPQAQRHGSPDPQADQPGGPGVGTQGDQPAQPDPQGRQRRHGRGARGGSLGIQVDDEVELRVIDRGVGGITETNVNLASASDAIVIGFNVRAEGEATELANREGLEIRRYSVIYQAIDEIEKALEGVLKPIYEEKELGRAEIRAIFRSSKVGNIAGCLVQSGVMRRNAKARLLREQRRHRREPHRLLAQAPRRTTPPRFREGFGGWGLTLTYTGHQRGRRSSRPYELGREGTGDAQQNWVIMADPAQRQAAGPSGSRRSSPSAIEYEE